MQRRDLLATGAAVALGTGPGDTFAAPKKVLRASFPTAEVGFDPIQISDGPSLTVIDLIFEAPLTYDALARPALLKPLTAATFPEVSADFRRFTFTIGPASFSPTTRCSRAGRASWWRPTMSIASSGCTTRRSRPSGCTSSRTPGCWA